MFIDPRKQILLAVAGIWAGSALAQELPATDWRPAGSGYESSGQVQNALGGNPALYSYYQRVAFQQRTGQPLPPDPTGPERMQLPTPAEGFGYYGAPHEALNTNPAPKTMGIRLDTSYTLLRSIDAGVFLSEHQDIFAGGFTLLPYQTPCFVVGTRVLGDFVDNLSMTNDTGGFSADIFLGTRYKTTYWKFGAFYDWQDELGKVGGTCSLLTKAPIFGFLTFDTAFAAGVGPDDVGPTREPFFGVRPRRVEAADYDMQLRVGKFITPNLQIGATGNYYQFEYTKEERGAGAFANIYCGRVQFGFDVTGGDEGLRGFCTVSIAWGAHPSEHPQDCRFIPLDTVAWVTSPTMRDISVRLRDSFTGPLPLAP